MQHPVKTASEPSLYVTRREAAHLLGGIDERTVDRWLRKGYLKKAKVPGKRILILRSSIEALAE